MKAMATIDVSGRNSAIRNTSLSCNTHKSINFPSGKKQRRKLKFLKSNWISNFQLVDSNINERSPKLMRILFDTSIRYTSEGKQMY